MRASSPNCAGEGNNKLQLLLLELLLLRLLPIDASLLRLLPIEALLLRSDIRPDSSTVAIVSLRTWAQKFRKPAPFLLRKPVCTSSTINTALATTSRKECAMYPNNKQVKQLRLRVRTRPFGVGRPRD
jgi:hypothetical protein